MPLRAVAAAPLPSGSFLVRRAVSEPQDRVGGEDVAALAALTEGVRDVTGLGRVGIAPVARKREVRTQGGATVTAPPEPLLAAVGVEP